MGGLIKFFIIAFAVYFLVRFLFRLILPFAMRKAAEKLMKKAQQQGGSYTGSGQGGAFYYEFNGKKQQGSEYSTSNEGKIRVDYIPPKENATRKGAETAGEIVDFEEIK